MADVDFLAGRCPEMPGRTHQLLALALGHARCKWCGVLILGVADDGTEPPGGWWLPGPEDAELASGGTRCSARRGRCDRRPAERRSRARERFEGRMP